MSIEILRNNNINYLDLKKIFFSLIFKFIIQKQNKQKHKKYINFFDIYIYQCRHILITNIQQQHLRKSKTKTHISFKKNRDDLLNNINNILLGYSIQKLQQQQQNIILKLKCENRFIYYIHT